MFTNWMIILKSCFFRNEIASCGEAAYERLPLKDAATLLFFPNRSDLLRFAEEVSDLPKTVECSD
jgi:hypothetical protein